MTGRYLFNYESYYNGLMTDWGLKLISAEMFPRFLSFFSLCFLLLTFLCDTCDSN